MWSVRLCISYAHTHLEMECGILDSRVISIIWLLFINQIIVICVIYFCLRQSQMHFWLKLSSLPIYWYISTGHSGWAGSTNSLKRLRWFLDFVYRHEFRQQLRYLQRNRPTKKMLAHNGCRRLWGHTCLCYCLHWQNEQCKLIQLTLHYKCILYWQTVSFVVCADVHFKAPELTTSNS